MAAGPPVAAFLLAGPVVIGTVKLVLPTWDQYLAVALNEIIALPGLLPTVTHRLTRLLDDLAAIAPPDRRPELQQRRAQIAPPA